MKYLSNSINWEDLTHIGWDLDGTLYDEFSFIKQAYVRVINRFAVDQDQAKMMLNFMLGKWMEKGSSYPFIFGEVFDLIFKANQGNSKIFVDEAVSLFRSTNPKLELNERLRFLLTEMADRFKLFLLTDGHEHLQRAKMNALGLADYFEEKHIHISGVYGKGFEKPNTKVLEKLLEKGSISEETKKVLYIGDRLRDKQFAENVGFSFCYIQDLFKRID